MKILKTTQFLLSILFIAFFISCSDDNNDNIEPEEKEMELGIAKSEDFIDTRDNTVYPTVKIGEQIWMAKNLRFKLEGKSWAYNDDENNVAKYGRLYTWESLEEVIPNGWHLPTDKEWQTLEAFLGMTTEDLDKSGYSINRGEDQGTQLKEGGKSLLNFPISGFRDYTGTFEALENRTYLWVNTEVEIDNKIEVYRRRIVKAESGLYRFTNPSSSFAITVRLVKD